MGAANGVNRIKWAQRDPPAAMMARLHWGYLDWAIEGLEALQPRVPVALRPAER
jgi:hypothetical protein